MTLSNYSKYSVSRKTYWVVVIAIGVCVAIFVFFFTKNIAEHSASYQVATAYLQRSSCVTEELGPVKSINLLMHYRGYQNNRNALLNVSISGSKKVGRAEIRLRMIDRKWHVTSLELFPVDSRSVNCPVMEPRG
ncbi:MAG: cytochrome c oxidase assembly factor Coa1 family protein [Gammaproteobacteria bacterium]